MTGTPSNPFEDADSGFLVLANSQGQYSLWPAFAVIPQGWNVVKEEDDRARCIAFIKEHWVDLRPPNRADAPDVSNTPSPEDPG